jgi:hypothetical protein
VAAGCEHGKDRFALWISIRPGYLLCGFCYLAAQVLAEDIRCAACAGAAGDPDTDVTGTIAKISDELGARFYLCGHAPTLISPFSSSPNRRAVGSICSAP